jgi:dynein heavy chain 1
VCFVYFCGITLPHVIDAGKKLEWADIRKKLMEPTFISSVVNYDTKKHLSTKVRMEVQKSYLTDESFKFDVVNRASKACGPMCKWVTAQIFYSDILVVVSYLL